MRLAKWLAITVLALYLVLKGSLVFTVPMRTLATVYDNGPAGYSLLIDRLRSMGNRVYLTLPAPQLARHQVLLILDPLFCGKGYLDALWSWVSEAQPRLILVIGSSPCAHTIADWLSGARSDTVYLRNASIVVDGLRGYTFLQAVKSVEGGAAIGIVEGAPGLHPGYRAGRVVYIGGADMLRNARLSRNPSNAAALASMMGCSEGGCTVVIPSVLETGSLGVSVSLFPLALALASLLVALERWAQGLLDGLLVVAYTLLAGAVAARYMLRGVPRAGRERVERRPEPPELIAGTAEYLAVVERGWKALPGKLLVQRLYEMVDVVLRYRVGAGIELVVRDETLLEKAAALAGVDPERLRSVLVRLSRLARRARGESRWPLLVLWGRASRRLLAEAEEVLKGLGVSLGDLRSLEVALEHVER